MAYLAVVGSKAVNGVAAIHSEIIKDTIFKARPPPPATPAPGPPPGTASAAHELSAHPRPALVLPLPCDMTWC
jgi:hypothetical protein